MQNKIGLALFAFISILGAYWIFSNIDTSEHLTSVITPIETTNVEFSQKEAEAASLASPSIRMALISSIRMKDPSGTEDIAFRWVSGIHRGTWGDTENRTGNYGSVEIGDHVIMLPDSIVIAGYTVKDRDNPDVGYLGLFELDKGEWHQLMSYRLGMPGIVAGLYAYGGKIYVQYKTSGSTKDNNNSSEVTNTSVFNYSNKVPEK